MKVVVTGGLGFIGTTLTKALLERKCETRIIDDGRRSIGDKLIDSRIVLRRPFASREALSYISDFKPDVVIHLAAYARVGEGETEPLSYLRNNLYATVEFFEALNTPAILFASSSAAVGNPPASWYGSTKLAVESYLRTYVRKKPAKIFILRIFNAAGSAHGLVEPESSGRVIPAAVRAAIKNRPFKVNGDKFKTKDGTAVRDYVHVSDIARAFILAAEAAFGGSSSHEPIDIGTGVGSSLLRIANTVRRVSGRHLDVEIAEHRTGDADSSISDPTNAEKIIGWKPSLSLEDCVRDSWQAITADGL